MITLKVSNNRYVFSGQIAYTEKVRRLPKGDIREVGRVGTLFIQTTRKSKLLRYGKTKIALIIRTQLRFCTNFEDHKSIWRAAKNKRRTFVAELERPQSSDCMEKLLFLPDNQLLIKNVSFYQ